MVDGEKLKIDNNKVKRKSLIIIETKDLNDVT